MNFLKDGQSTSRAMLSREQATDKQTEEFMKAINAISLIDLEAEQVYIRSMYLASTQYVEQDDSRFTNEALEQAAQLIVGRSVMVGHDREELPIARFFAGIVLQREGDQKDPVTGLPVFWLRAWFYWLGETTGAQDLMLNIDGGIYRDVSISWRFRKATCSICGENIWGCPHLPGCEYDGDLCHILIEEIEDIMEGSIVFQGADEGAELAGRQKQVKPPGGLKPEPPGGSEVVSEGEAFPGLAGLELDLQLRKFDERRNLPEVEREPPGGLSGLSGRGGNEKRRKGR